MLLIGLSVWRLRSLERIPRAFLVTGAGALCLYLLFAIAQDAYSSYGASEVRAATSSRYQLPTALFLVLMAANLLKGIRFPPWTIGLAAVLSLFAISGGVQLMSDKAHERWEPAADYTRATLSGVERSAPDYPAGQTFRPGTSFDVPVEDYLQAVEAHGSPAFSEGELRGMGPPFRLTADASLISSSNIAITGDPPTFADLTCRALQPSQTLKLGPGSYSVANLGLTDLAVSAAQFSDPPGILIGSVLPNATAGLSLPDGSSTSRWTLSFAGKGPLRICTGTAAA